MTDRRAAGNKGFAIAGVPCFADTFVQSGSLVLRMKFSAKNSQPSQTPETLWAMPRDRNGASNAGTFACCSFHRDTKASKRA
jgi:hypothetical protein